MPSETTPGTNPYLEGDTAIANEAAAAVVDNAALVDGPPVEFPPSLPEPASVEKDPSSVLKRVTKTSFTFKSNIDTPSERDAQTCGVLHATKTVTVVSRVSNGGCEEHAFGWISNINNTTSINAVTNYLSKFGYVNNRSNGLKFIPYTSKESWAEKYPHATLQFDVSDDGKVVGDAQWEADNTPSLSLLAAKKKPAKKRATRKTSSKHSTPTKLIPTGILSNTSRSELHHEIYNYFTWLHSQLSQMETNNVGRRAVLNAGMNVPALKGVIGKLEGAFKNLQEVNTTKEEGEGGGGDDGMGMEDSKMPALPPLPGATGGGVKPSIMELPYLEQVMEGELPSGAASALSSGGRKRPPPSVARGASSAEAKVNWRALDFDTLFQKLVQYKAEKGGTATPPSKHPELGRWTSELRSKKKALREKGMEFESAPLEEEEDDVVEGSAEAPPKKKQKKEGGKSVSNTYLTEERVAQLDSIAFPWSVIPARASWEERFEELKQFKETHGRFPTTKEGTIGNWLKTQKKLFTKQDADWLARRKPKFDEIGVPLRQRTFTVMSWDDRFQQLVEFGRNNGHFNVPNPAKVGPWGDAADEDPNSEAADQRRFYKFVSKLHTEYRSVQRGIPSSMLTEDRITQLRNISFEFKCTRSEKVIPEVDWSTRIQQLESFKTEMGHLRVDPNYDKFGNLGAWAVQISESHKNWQEGREYLQPDMTEKFNQLSEMGFGFDVFKTRRGERSWEDSYALLLQYREENGGSTKVPHHYKADFRLGSWVAVQRKEYKLLQEGKNSRLTQERLDKLEEVGFEWAPRRGQDD